MNDYHARFAFHVERREQEQWKAELTCLSLIAKHLVDLNHSRYNVTYSIKVIPHEFDERLNYVHIDAIVAIDGAK